jgi:hypothetical protein
MFPGQQELGQHMDNVWAALKAVTDDLDKWESQLSASEFKSLVHKFLTLLTDHSPVSDPSPNSSPSSPQPVVQPDVRNTSSPISAFSVNREDARRKELSKWSPGRIRTLLQKLGCTESQFIRNKTDLVDAVIDLEFANHSDEGDNSEEEDSESEDNQLPEDVRRAQLQRTKLAGPDGVAAQAKKLGVFKSKTRKADLVEAILEKERNSGPSPSHSPSAARPALPARISTAARLGFKVGIITPYMHASGAHLWEQRLHLAKLGKFIGHPLTHKHISCSPGELSNNTYNRTYFQTSSRRLDGLEKTILLTSWRAILNTVDLDRTQHKCPYCPHKTVRAEWMRRHITTMHPHVLPINQ